MNTKTVIECDTTGIVEVTVTWDVTEANALLVSGQWVIMHAGLAHQDGQGFVAKPCFVLARTEGGHR